MADHTFQNYRFGLEITSDENNQITKEDKSVKLLPIIQTDSAISHLLKNGMIPLLPVIQTRNNSISDTEIFDQPEAETENTNFDFSVYNKVKLTNRRRMQNSTRSSNLSLGMSMTFSSFN